MKETKNINVKLERPGFKNIISNTLGMIAAGAIVLVIASIMVMAIFKFLWPTLKWLVPLSLVFIYIIFTLYEITKKNDNETRSYYQYKITLVLMRTILILAIFLYDIESVAG